MEKLGLELGQDFSNLIFISSAVLKREPEWGGITLQNEKEIFFASPGSQLVREKGTQTELSGAEIKELEEKMEGLEIKLTDSEKIKNV
jgi:hypothetical protein